MKLRGTILLAIAFTGIIFSSSCNRSYICHCDIKYNGYPGLPDSTTKEFDIVDTKSGADSKCTGESGTFNNNGIISVETCYLY